MSSKISHSLGVISAITALYLLNLEQAAVQLAWVNIHFGTVGEENTETDWSYFVSNINALLIGSIADALLVRISTLRKLSG